MPAYVWISLGVFLVCLVAGAIWAGVNALRAWRGVPALRRLSAASAALSGRSTELERRLTVLQPKVAHLQHETARLQRGVARARVLLGAVQEARTVARVARLFVP
jgi:hypothetical protein